MPHPEADPAINQLFEEMGAMELVDVWCNGCGAFRKMNSNFAKYLHGEIDFMCQMSRTEAEVRLEEPNK